MATIFLSAVRLIPPILGPQRSHADLTGTTSKTLPGDVDVELAGQVRKEEVAE